MTIDEAINRLKKLKSIHNGSYAQDIDMAIKALEQQYKWGKLYLWLNDMHLGIAPDEYTPSHERRVRKAQTDIIKDIMEWIEANVLEVESEDKE